MLPNIVALVIAPATLGVPPAFATPLPALVGLGLDVAVEIGLLGIPPVGWMRGSLLPTSGLPLPTSANSCLGSIGLPIASEMTALATSIFFLSLMEPLIVP